MIEAGQLRKFVDEESIMLGILGGDLLLVLELDAATTMVEVLMQSGAITKFSEGWMRCYTVVVDG